MTLMIGSYHVVISSNPISTQHRTILISYILRLHGKSENSLNDYSKVMLRWCNEVGLFVFLHTWRSSRLLAMNVKSKYSKISIRFWDQLRFVELHWSPVRSFPYLRCCQENETVRKKIVQSGLYVVCTFNRIWVFLRCLLNDSTKVEKKKPHIYLSETVRFFFFLSSCPCKNMKNVKNDVNLWWYCLFLPYYQKCFASTLEKKIQRKRFKEMKAFVLCKGIFWPPAYFCDVKEMWQVLFGHFEYLPFCFWM